MTQVFNTCRDRDGVQTPVRTAIVVAQRDATIVRRLQVIHPPSSVRRPLAKCIFITRVWPISIAIVSRTRGSAGATARACAGPGFSSRITAGGAAPRSATGAVSAR